MIEIPKSNAREGYAVTERHSMRYPSAYINFRK